MGTTAINNRISMAGPCGIDCAICELYIYKDDDELYQYLLRRGILKKKLPCPDCRLIKEHRTTLGITNEEIKTK